MPCCGQAMVVRPKPTPSGDTDSRERATRATVQFQYTGRTGLTVTGPVTGMQYRFTGPGTILPVDARDQRHVALVPHLRRVS